MAYTFGEFIAQKRKDREMSLRQMAEKINVSAVFISDMEKGRRYPSVELLKKIAEVLRLNQEETDLLYDLSSDERNQIPADLPEYIMDVPMAKVALRKAREADVSDAFWEEVIKKLEEKK